jgi:hypothetical protein
LAICRNGTAGAEVVALRETKPPFSPEQVTADYAALLKTYGITEIRGDHYAGEFPRELFRKAGISYFVSGKPKSDIYKELLPALNSGRYGFSITNAWSTSFAGWNAALHVVVVTLSTMPRMRTTTLRMLSLARCCWR